MEVHILTADESEGPCSLNDNGVWAWAGEWSLGFK